MFVWSVKTTRPRVIATVALIVLLLITVLVLSGRDAAKQTAAPVHGKTDAERRAYLTELGYELDPVHEVREVLIPAEFDEAFTAYNGIQKAAGCDLAPYRGERVKLWTYTVQNIPGNGTVVAHLYVYKDKIIGGDISDTAAGGFCHGLTAPDDG